MPPDILYTGCLVYACSHHWPVGQPAAAAASFSLQRQPASKNELGSLTDYDRTVIDVIDSAVETRKLS